MRILYEDLLSNDVIRTHRLNEPETAVRVEEMLALMERDLKYAAGGGLPLDLHYTCAYSAARTAAEIVMLAEGFRPGRAMGKHVAVLEFLRFVDAGRWNVEAHFFNRARAKRNILEYERPGVATEADVAELEQRTRRFCEDVLSWLRTRYPDLLPPSPSEPS